MVFFADMEKLIFKFIGNCKGLWIVKTMLEKKNKFGGLTLPSFNTYYKATVIKEVIIDIQINGMELRIQK